MRGTLCSMSMFAKPRLSSVEHLEKHDEVITALKLSASIYFKKNYQLCFSFNHQKQYNFNSFIYRFISMFVLEIPLSLLLFYVDVTQRCSKLKRDLRYQ